MTNRRNSSFNPRMSRRRFIASAAAVAGAAGLAGTLPEMLARAASARPMDFDLSQVKHIVYLMQENRSFDHYFGTFPGARGFSDPTAIRLPNGRSVFQQPNPANPDGFLQPYHMSTITTGAAAVPSLSHDWRDQHAAWNYGGNDGWLLTHLASDGDVNGSFTMGYYEQEDLPFHWALAQSFTLLDNYHCGVLGPTNPNRLVWMTGTLDPQGEHGGPVLETKTPDPLHYTTVAEILYNAGYTVKNYGDLSYNTWAWFAQFIDKTVPEALYNLVMSSGTLFGNGAPGGVGNPDSPISAANADLAFEEDCANGVLADVSYLFPPGTTNEHPPNIPALGAQLIASKLEALAANEDLWNSTVFVLNYDENDGIFDHVVPPTPNRERYPEEFVSVPSPKGTPGGGLPVGAGFRVPAIIVSPWTVGGRIFSELSDHTSTLRFIEAVTAAGGLSGHGPVTFPAISRWRRDTFGDFTSALRFGRPQPSPSNTQFDAATTATYVAAQTASSKLPMPQRPGATQDFAYATITAPGDIQAGSPVTVTATLTNGANLPLQGARLALSAPAGWQVNPENPVTARTLTSPGALTGSWQVTAPATAQDSTSQLTATASYQADGPGGGTDTTTADTEVFVDPLITTTATPQATIAQAGQASKVTITNTDTSGYPVTLTWAAAPPSGSGISVAPASGSASLTPRASSTTTLTITASAPGTATVPVNVTVTADGTTLPGPSADLQIIVPFPSLAAAYDNTGITDDSNPAPGNFDGDGNSFSAEALAAAGITPGGTFTSGGVTFTWPNVPAGQPDNVVAGGQGIAVSGSGSTLGFLGAANNGAASGTGTVYYTDGSTQSFTIGFQNWIKATPVSGDALVATTSYVNRTTTGPAQKPSLFAASVPLEAGKTVAVVALPDISRPAVNSTTTSMHIFALGLG